MSVFKAQGLHTSSNDGPITVVECFRGNVQFTFETERNAVELRDFWKQRPWDVRQGMKRGDSVEDDKDR